MKVIIFFLAALFFEFSYAQDLEAKLVNTFDLDADYFVGIDDLENIYFVKNNTLFKKRKTETLNYTNVSLGKISWSIYEIHLK